MDVPVEITSVDLFLTYDPGAIEGEFELPEGSVPCPLAMDDAGTEGVLLRVSPEVRASATGFTLTLRAAEGPPETTASKRRWLPRWRR